MRVLEPLRVLDPLRAMGGSVGILQPIALTSPLTGAVLVNAEGAVLTRGYTRVTPIRYAELYVLDDDDEPAPLYVLNSADEYVPLKVGV
jgi:hypothetical protein